MTRYARRMARSLKSSSVRLLGETILLVTAAVIPYTFTINSYFLGDDFGFIGLFHDKPLTYFPALFSREWTGGIFGEQTDEVRPLVALSYRIDALFGSTNPLVYHASNIVEHAAATLLVYAIVNLATRDRRGIALSAALLFAVLPAHSEAVAWISGRADSISTLVFLVTLTAFMLFRVRNQYRWYTLSLVAFFFALYAKESSIVLPLLFVGYDVLVDQRRDGIMRSVRRSIPVLLPYVSMTLAYLAFRWYALGEALREGHISLGLLDEFVSRQRDYLWALFLPDDPFVFPKAAAGGLPILVLAMAAAATIGFVSILSDRAGRWQSVRLLVYFGPLWYIVAVAPLIVTYFSPRHLYFASVGTSIAVPLLWFTPGRVAPRALATGALLAFLLSAHTLALYRANGVWEAAGNASRTISEEVERIGAQLPDASRVVLAVSPEIHGTVLWAWALPFVFEEPFSRGVLYDRLEIIEHPYAYCCRTLWPRDRLGRLEKWVSDPDGSEIHVLSWNDRQRRLDSKKQTLTAEIAEQVSLLRRLLDIGDDRRVYPEMLHLFAALTSNAR